MSRAASYEAILARDSNAHLKRGAVIAVVLHRRRRDG